MEDNSFLDKKFMKDIKRLFIPTKIFNQNIKINIIIELQMLNLN